MLRLISSSLLIVWPSNTFKCNPTILSQHQISAMHTCSILSDEKQLLELTGRSCCWFIFDRINIARLDCKIAVQKSVSCFAAQAFPFVEHPEDKTSFSFVEEASMESEESFVRLKDSAFFSFSFSRLQRRENWNQTNNLWRSFSRRPSALDLGEREMRHSQYVSHLWAVWIEAVRTTKRTDHHQSIYLCGSALMLPLLRRFRLQVTLRRTFLLTLIIGSICPILIYIHESEYLHQSFRRPIRVFCLILTAPKYFATRARAVNLTWAPRCDRYLFISEYSDQSHGLPLASIINIQPGYQHLTQKVSLALIYVYEQFRDDFDWFLKSDDDTYVFVENLKRFLSRQNPSLPITFGYNYKVRIRWSRSETVKKNFEERSGLTRCR